MKTYELIVERKQPACGGKDPKDVKILSVTTEDPEAYVRGIEKNGELQVSRETNGELVITLDAGERHVKYTFKEE